jgi:uncharacterized protein
MEIVWDPFKARSNLAKHGVEFRDAAAIFDGPTIQFPDRRQDYREDRFKAVGLAGADVLVVVFVRRGADIRLISARKASSEERMRYEAATRNSN